MQTSRMQVLKVLLLLVLVPSCQPTPSQQPEPNGVTVLENGRKLSGMTDFDATFAGTPVSGNTVTISFSTRFDPIVNAIDDEYRLTFSLAFPDAGVLSAGSIVDLSSVTGLSGLFEVSCFCADLPRYSAVSSGTLNIEEISPSAIKGSLAATFVLTDRLDRLSGNPDRTGRSYDFSIESFAASLAKLPAPPD